MAEQTCHLEAQDPVRLKMLKPALGNESRGVRQIRVVY